VGDNRQHVDIDLTTSDVFNRVFLGMHDVVFNDAGIFHDHLVDDAKA